MRKTSGLSRRITLKKLDIATPQPPKTKPTTHILRDSLRFSLNAWAKGKVSGGKPNFALRTGIKVKSPTQKEERGGEGGAGRGEGGGGAVVPLTSKTR